MSDGRLRRQDWISGLDKWLAHHGVEVGQTLVLDEQSAAFPAPVIRQAGGYEFQDVHMIDYPYFIDLRPPGLATDPPVTSNLPQLTMAWASPIHLRPSDDRRSHILLQSSPKSWTSNGMEIMPSLGADGLSSFLPRASGDTGDDSVASRRGEILGVTLQGRFHSFYTGRPHPLDETPADDAGYRATGYTSLIQHSPESARIVLYASNDFMDDQILNVEVAATGTQYLGPVELFMNTLDWALQDDQLLQIRSSAHFNRTLPPMERQAQAYIEYFNYGLAILWLGLLALLHWILNILRRRRYSKRLSL